MRGELETYLYAVMKSDDAKRRTLRSEGKKEK